MTRVGAVFASLLLCVLLVPAVHGQSMAVEDTVPSIDPEMMDALASKSALAKVDPDLVGPYDDVARMGLKSIHTGPGFEGFGFDDNSAENGGFLFIPPDPIGAAGKSRVIAVVNTMIEARTKAASSSGGIHSPTSSPR
jgi:hypothetical protein